jgi:hypothetical protein
LEGDNLWNKIIESSSKGRQSANQKLGLQTQKSLVLHYKEVKLLKKSFCAEKTHKNKILGTFFHIL